VKTVYICDYCGLEFTNFRSCLDHEDNDHIKVRYASPVEYSGANTKYPTTVHVTLEDDTVLAFTYSHMVKSASKEVEEAEEVA
jgi:hypothetical protein